MATGYDNRSQGGRSFAFSNIAPVARQSGLQAAAPRIGVEGGETQSGVQNATAQTGFSAESALPAFIEQALEPAIKQRQLKLFNEGILATHSKEAMNEIEAERPAWSRVFGDSAYEAGAVYHHSQQAVSDYFAGLTARHDELIQMPPEQSRKIVADGMADLMTDSDGANILIQDGFIKASGPFMDQLVKGRQAWVQTQAVQAQISARQSASSLFDNSERSYDMMEPDKALSSVGERGLGRKTFQDSFAAVPGQTIESDILALKTAGTSMLQQGQFRSFRAFKQSDAYLRIPAEDRIKLEDHQTRYEKIALGKAAADRVYDMVSERTALEQFKTYQLMTPAEQAQARTKGYTPPTPSEMIQRRANIAKAIQMDTGAETPFYKPEELADIGIDMVDALFSAQRKALDDNHQQQRFTQQEDYKFMLKHQEDQIKADAARAAASSGTLMQGLMNGQVDKDHADDILRTAYETGDLPTLIRNFGTGLDYGAVSKGAQQTIAWSSGHGYSAPMAKTVDTFRSLMAAKQNGLALELYGEYYAELVSLSSLVDAGDDKQVAYDKTFGPKALPVASMFGVKWDEAKGITNGVNRALDNLRPDVLGIRLSDTLSDNAKRAVSGPVLKRLQLMTRGSKPSEDDIKGAIQASLNTGEIAVYGQYGWVNRNGDRTPLEAVLKTDKETTTRLLTEAVAAAFPERLKPKNPERHITEIVPTQVNGKTILHMVYHNKDDGTDYTVAINSDDLIARRDARDRQTLKGMTAPSIMPMDVSQTH